MWQAAAILPLKFTKKHQPNDLLCLKHLEHNNAPILHSLVWVLTTRRALLSFLSLPHMSSLQINNRLPCLLAFYNFLSASIFEQQTNCYINDQVNAGGQPSQYAASVSQPQVFQPRQGPPPSTAAQASRSNPEALLAYLQQMSAQGATLPGGVRPKSSEAQALQQSLQYQGGQRQASFYFRPRASPCPPPPTPFPFPHYPPSSNLCPSSCLFFCPAESCRPFPHEMPVLVGEKP